MNTRRDFKNLKKQIFRDLIARKTRQAGRITLEFIAYVLGVGGMIIGMCIIASIWASIAGK